MKRKIVVGVIIGTSALGASAAWALLSGTVVIPNIAEGIATGTAGSCQTSAVNFVVPEPTWNPTSATWEVTTLTYNNIDTACINLGTADLELYVVKSGITVANATDTNMTNAAGTLNIAPPLNISTFDGANFNYLVKG